MTKNIKKDWDQLWMEDAYKWSYQSKDPRTKIGAVIINPEYQVFISSGYNGFARKVNEILPERWERPEKYSWVVHAEDNAILNCALLGRSSRGGVMYTQGIPCTDCANSVIQGGITKIYVHKQWMDHENNEADFRAKWSESSKRSIAKFQEVGIVIEVKDFILDMKGYLNGKELDV